MKNKYLLFILPLIIFVGYSSLTSFSGGISGSSTSGCGCHSPIDLSTMITLTGLPAGGYTNGATYTLTLTVINTSITGPQPRDGFNLSVTEGVFINPPTGITLVDTQEIMHSAPVNAVAGMASWEFTWRAPLTGNASATFSAAGNATNGDGGPGTEDKWNLYTVVVPKGGGVTIGLKLFLESFYAGASSMQPVLSNQGIGSSTTVTDSIIVELKDENTFATVATCNAILNTDGSATCNFAVSPGSYYIAVIHRNALLTWSGAPVNIGASNNFYDFSNAATKSFGNNVIQVDPGVWAFYQGEINKDENVDLLDLGLLETDISNFSFGYFATDLTGDGNVDLLDAPILELNISNFVFSNHP